jgi:hypothetical protein
MKSANSIAAVEVTASGKRPLSVHNRYLSQGMNTAVAPCWALFSQYPCASATVAGE